MGSSYLCREWENAILFVEEVREPISQVDRLLTQLKLAGILDKIRGFVFGQCMRCEPPEGDGSLTLEEVLSDQIKPLVIPAWSGALIGHVERQFTIPVGLPAAIDARKGTIRLREPAVA